MPLAGRVHALTIPFAATVTHASAARTGSDSVWVELRDHGHIGLGEGCPRPYVTGEDTPGALAWLRDVGRDIAGDVTDVDDLRHRVGDAHEEIDRHPAAWCALELALLDLFARRAGVTVERALGVPENVTVFRYSAVIDDVDDARFDLLCQVYAAAGVDDVKMKLRGDASDAVRVARLLTPIEATDGGRSEPWVRRLRLDANNLWGTDAAAARAALHLLAEGTAAVEEPLAAGRPAELSALAGHLDMPVILDESLTRVDDVAEYAAHPGAWIANVKVSKCGGLLRSLAVVEAARGRGWPVIIGAQVGETSVLTRAGMVAARAAGTDLFAHGGAFGTHLLTYDVVAPVLAFGRGGEIDLDGTPVGGAPGFGLRPETTAGEEGRELWGD
jgi:L-alanine-DL-glutamate epimerase-like enolase superfamily enzyme